MYPEVGDRHFPRGDEGSGAGEQSSGDQKPRDQLDQPGVPAGTGSDHDCMRRADGPTEDIHRAVRGEEEAVDQPKQAQHSRHRRGETVIEIFRHEVDVTVAVYVSSQPLLALSISRGMQTDVAYALWSAIGTAAVVLVAVLFRGSPVSMANVVRP